MNRSFTSFYYVQNDTALWLTTKECLLAFCFSVFFTLCAHLAAAQPVAAAKEKSVIPFNGKKLEYVPHNGGDRICDFSGAGYKGGGVAIPDNVPVKAVVENGPGDDTKRIQQAIDDVSALPLQNGFRGTVQLDTGIFVISSPLKINASGVVLKGKGPGRLGTVIKDVSTDTESVSVQISGGSEITILPETEITTDPVPVGTKTFAVANASPFHVGDSIQILRPVNRQWVDDLNQAEGWDASQFTLRWIRTVAKRDKNTLTLDFPIPSRIDKHYGTATVSKVAGDGRLFNIGIEDILFIADYDPTVVQKTDFGNAPIDENHSQMAIYWGDHLRDGWTRRCVGFFYWRAFIRTSSSHYSSNITIEDCAMLDPVSKNNGESTGMARAYNFMITGNKVLAQRLYSRGGRHDLAMAGTHEGNIFLDCVTEITTLNNEPHQKWTQASLYDCCLSDKPFQLVYSKGTHGKRNANNVLWNCKVVDSDPLWNNWRWWGRENMNRISVCGTEVKPGTNIRLANNYAIGCTAELLENDHHFARGQRTPVPPGAEGIIESPNQPREPRSLYLQQLKERKGKKAVENIAIKQQTQSSDKVWDYLRNLYKDIPHFADPGHLDWLPKMVNFEKPIAQAQE